MSAHLEGAHDGHHHSLGLCSPLAAVAVTVLADQDRRADSPLPAVVVRRYFVVIQKGEQFLAVASQPLLQPSGVLLLPFLVDELVQAFPDSGLPSFIDFQRHPLFGFLQPHAVPDQAAQAPVKFRPVLAGIVVVSSPAQVSQQMGQALLLGQAHDRVVSTPEVGNQHPVEKCPEQLLQHTATTTGIDQVVHCVLGRQTPQPEGLTQHPPSRLVGVQHRMSLDVFQDAVVPGPEDLAHAVPCLDKAAFCHREMQMVVVDIQNLAQRCPLQVMHHPRKADRPVPDLAVRQSVLHHWLHLFPAVRTPVPGEHMLGDRWLGILLEVLDDPGTT